MNDCIYKDETVHVKRIQSAEPYPSNKTPPSVNERVVIFERIPGGAVSSVVPNPAYQIVFTGLVG